MNKLLCAILFLMVSSILCAGELVPFDRVTVGFPEKKEASALLMQEDSFLTSLSDMDRSLRLKTRNEVSLPEYTTFVGKQALDWKEPEKKTMIALLESIKPSFRKYQLNFPADLVLIKTTGKEEGNAAYCRGQNAIVFPVGYLSLSNEELRDILIHELFHIFSKNNPSAQESLYGIIGFYKALPLSTVQKQIQSRLITNPDAFSYDYYFKAVVGAESYAVMPILVATAPYDSGLGGEFFEYFALQFLAVSVEADKTVPLIAGNKYVVFPISKIANYFDMVGENTEYIIHPEEILADNFVLMVNGRRDLKTPRIVDEMSAILKK